jgi:hypothetical protein
MVIETDEAIKPLEMQTVQEGPGLTPDYTKIYPEVFSEEGFEELLPWQKWDHMINIKPDSTPPHGKCYPLSKAEREELWWFIQFNQSAEKIHPSMSLYTSPFFFHLKPGTSELWGIQDYQRLNDITVKECYPLPLISKVMAKVTESSCFTKWIYDEASIISR